MNVFKEVKERVTTRQVAEGYGLKINRYGMCVCPFHDDKNPSMKLDSRYHCFACGEDGDVINFVEKYFGLSPIDSARKINDDFNLGINFSYFCRSNVETSEVIKQRKELAEKQNIAKAFDISRRDYINILSSYHRLLWTWKRDFAPIDESVKDANWHPFFVEACKNLDIVNDLIDALTFGSKAEQIDIINTYGKELDLLAKRIEKYN